MQGKARRAAALVRAPRTSNMSLPSRLGRNCCTRVSLHVESAQWPSRAAAGSPGEDVYVLGPGAARYGGHARLRVHGHIPHPGEVDDEPAVAQGAPCPVVPTAASTAAARGAARHAPPPARPRVVCRTRLSPGRDARRRSTHGSPSHRVRAPATPRAGYSPPQLVRTA
jgi:hypothetical protein